MFLGGLWRTSHVGSRTGICSGQAQGLAGPEIVGGVGGVRGGKGGRLAQRPDRSAESATRWHRVKVGGWLLLTVALIAGFLIYLMYRPMRRRC